jgi:hypothetical protein
MSRDVATDTKHSRHFPTALEGSLQHDCDKDGASDSHDGGTEAHDLGAQHPQNR